MAIRLVPKGRDPRRGLVMLAGPSNSGKTYSALRMAVGLREVLGGGIAMLDTENRGNLYEGDFGFDRWVMDPPFTPKAFMEAYEQLDSRYSVIITDNFSDSYEGIGGLLEMAEASGGTNEASKWAKPKAQDRQLMARVRQLASQHIFCLRAKDKIQIVDGEDRNGNRKKIVQPLGWMPICEKNFVYDVTLGFMLEPNARGRAQVVKTIAAFDGAYADGAVIDEAYGRALAAWTRHAEPARRGPAQAPAAPLVLRSESGDEIGRYGRGGEWLDGFEAVWRRDPDGRRSLTHADNLRVIERKILPKLEEGAIRDVAERYAMELRDDLEAVRHAAGEGRDAAEGRTH